MEYTYLLDEKANKNLRFDDIVTNNNTVILNLLCYHIDEQSKYPFLQFMMEKVPFCNNIVKEQLTLPSIFLRDTSVNIQSIVLDNIKLRLKMLGCEFNKITEDMYKGIIFIQDDSSPYAVVNITGIDIYGLNLTRQTLTWFVLTSEIINTRKICNLNMDSDITTLFTDYPKLGLLVNKKTNETFIIPDAVYTGGEIKTVEFNSIFGNSKKQIYKSCGDYYYFYRNFGDAVKDGGWVKEDDKDILGNRIILQNNNKYIHGGINRYALFIEGKIYLETNTEFSLTDTIIDNLYPEPCIIICYTDKHEIKPDVLVKNYESFVCISFHKLDKNVLQDKYIENNRNEYMIA